MRKVVILGYGNSYRQDDGLAQLALERLKLAGLPVEVECILAHQLLPEHSAVASQADLLIFVDASQSGASGEIRIERVFAKGKFPSPTHHMSPPALLTLLREVFGVEPEAYLATLKGECFELGEGVAPATEQLLPHFVQEIARIVEQRALK